MATKNQNQIATEIFNDHFDDVTRRALALCDRIVTLGVLDTMILPTGASDTHIAIELERLAVDWRSDELAGLGTSTDRDTAPIFAEGYRETKRVSVGPDGFDDFDRPTVRVNVVADDFDRPTLVVPVTVTATRIRRVA